MAKGSRQQRIFARTLAPETRGVIGNDRGRTILSLHHQLWRHPPARCLLVTWCLGVQLGDEVVNANTKIFLFSSPCQVWNITKRGNAQIHTVLEPTQSWFVINPGYAQLPGIQSVIAECGAAADEAL